MRSYHVVVTGLVQGVGFRPFVYRTALSYGLAGWVRNTNECVEIFVQGDDSIVRLFLDDLKRLAPRASRVEGISAMPADPEVHAGFRILDSRNTSGDITEISPDIAVCSDCLEDMQGKERRFHYPFTNCTNCGPRFTIITDLPYDRKYTSMKDFIMCPDCSREFRDVNDRRFHAQPTACPVCGPHYTLYAGDKQFDGIDEIIGRISGLLASGGVIAMKGLGGFHLACDAANCNAVDALRKVKNRDGKPFAVMFPDIERVKEYALINPAEENSLLSWRRPIVLLEQGPGKTLPQAISSGLSTLGVMLPYLPMHFLLFEHFRNPIVLTSGNLSDEPIITDNKKALETFSARCDAVLVNNREIENRTDDSVLRIVHGEPRLIRRSRSFVPEPVDIGMDTEGIFATGGELVNTFCIGKGRKAFLSQYIGNLTNADTTSFYEEMSEKFQRMFRFRPAIIVSDLHPDYFTTRLAQDMNGRIRHIQVQHHHAHVVSCMAEHGLDEPVIGIAFDGTGYGTDGHIWGGEFFYCDRTNFERYTHFDYIPLPGGDRGIEEPWRMAVSWLHRLSPGLEGFRDLPFLNEIDTRDLEVIVHMLRSGINSPLVSGAGRLFDAVSALVGLCRFATFPAEAPVRLEAAIEKGCHEEYPYIIGEKIFFDDTIRAIVGDIRENIKPGTISAKFHNTLVSVICRVVQEMDMNFRCKKVALSGGTFQNKYIVENVEERLEGLGYSVYSQKKIPASDGGLSLGQLAIAAKRRQ